VLREVQPSNAGRQLRANHRITPSEPTPTVSRPEAGHRGVASEGTLTPAKGARRHRQRYIRDCSSRDRLRLRLRGGRLRRDRQGRLTDPRHGRLMRHYLPPPLPVRLLPRRVGPPPVPAGLVPSPCLTDRVPPRTAAALLPAVPLARVTRATQKEHLPAFPPVAHHEAQGLHRTPAGANTWPDAPGCGTTGPTTGRLHAHPGTPSQRAFQWHLEGPRPYLGRAPGRPSTSSQHPLHRFSVSPGPPRTAPKPRPLCPSRSSSCPVATTTMKI
jgi:hypothetical protein